MRVDDVYSHINLVVRIDGQIVKKAKKKHVAPGEMESIKIRVEELRNVKGDCMTISLEGEMIDGKD